MGVGWGLSPPQGPAAQARGMVLVAAAGTCSQPWPGHVGFGKPLTGSGSLWRLQLTTCFLVSGKPSWAGAVLTCLFQTQLEPVKVNEKQEN